MKLPTPANDPREWTEDDFWMQCFCGSLAYNVLWREGYCYVLCNKCERDHTMDTIWGKHT